LASGSITAALASPSCHLHLDQQLDRRRLRLGQRTSMTAAIIFLSVA
jgi:hypothetical protein